MTNTSPIKAIQNGLRKHKLTASAFDIRQAAQDLNLDVNSTDCIDPLIDYFSTKNHGGTIATIDGVNLTLKPQETEILNTENGSNMPESNPENKSLTIAQKQSLTQIQAQQLGIELSQLEITEVSAMVATEITDSISYLEAVGEIIRLFIERRNNQASAAISEQISNIATIINTGNDQLGDIFDGANRQLSEIVSQCRQRKEDYKSPYSNRLESIREILQISQ